MAIVQTVDFCDFIQSFRDCGRGDNFSIQGLEMLFDYINDISNDMEKPYELDVIELCCDYCEQSYNEIVDGYFEEDDTADYQSLEDEQEKIDFILNILNQTTYIVGSNDEMVVFQCF